MKMPILVYLAYAAFVASGACVVATIGLETWVFVPGAVGGVTGGTLLLAAARIVDLLTDIRDRLPAATVATGNVDVDHPQPRVTRSLSELSVDLARARAAPRSW